jgi:hypothetical protein
VSLFLEFLPHYCFQGMDKSYCCICLVIYLNCTVMHGFTNLKFMYVSHLIRKVLRFETWSLGVGDHRQFKRTRVRKNWTVSI